MQTSLTAGCCPSWTHDGSRPDRHRDSRHLCTDGDGQEHGVAEARRPNEKRNVMSTDAVRAALAELVRNFVRAVERALFEGE